ncbi:MAG: HEPN domain-containing protein [Planctomycetes bacterium]|nr:HEPN domain-containing protein [Planctomycetota bacterium]MBU4400567.1 HEPN domain-containing protein [Planctomycetota bacterium]MCG2682051.1 HEPN domain-containing protein [Planctomycetales bacterium]
MPLEWELVREWLARAQADLQGAEVALGGRPLITEHVCFHGQQAVEKALKAFLVYHGVDFPWTHQIGPLLDLCIEQNGSFSRLVTAAVPLTEYAVRFRYPFFSPPPSLEQARAALATAHDVFAFVTACLPDETRP